MLTGAGTGNKSGLEKKLYIARDWLRNLRQIERAGVTRGRGSTSLGNKAPNPNQNNQNENICK